MEQWGSLVRLQFLNDSHWFIGGPRIVSSAGVYIFFLGEELVEKRGAMRNCSV